VSAHTRTQLLAQAAFPRVEARKKGKDFGEYETVARRFPSLIHTCGLAQAVAFAQAKRNQKKPEGGPECQYLADLAAVLHAGGHTEVTSADSLADHSRDDAVTTYLRLSRDALDATVWLKRYAEALSENTTPLAEAMK